jgi:hypothetical protein
MAWCATTGHRRDASDVDKVCVRVCKLFPRDGDLLNLTGDDIVTVLERRNGGLWRKWRSCWGEQKSCSFDMCCYKGAVMRQ